jgi:hypothetical protein
MASTELDRRGAHALSHEPLKVGVDGAILRGNGIEAWLGAPSGLSDPTEKKGAVKRLLDGK